MSPDLQVKNRVIALDFPPEAQVSEVSPDSVAAILCQTDTSTHYMFCMNNDSGSKFEMDR